jgi:hypothetical protein
VLPATAALARVEYLCVSLCVCVCGTVCVALGSVAKEDGTLPFLFSSRHQPKWEWMLNQQGRLLVAEEFSTGMGSVEDKRKDKYPPLGAMKRWQEMLVAWVREHIGGSEKRGRCVHASCPLGGCRCFCFRGPSAGVHALLLGCNHHDGSVLRSCL